VDVRRPALAIASIFLASCGDRLAHPPYSAHVTDDLVEVGYPPPPARAEQVPPRPHDGAVFVDGEWIWRGRRWSWSPGRWVDPPPGATFSPWTTVRRDDGAVFVAPGAWRAANGEPLEAPKALALAHVAPGVVFEPNGDIQRTGPTIDPDRRRDGGRQ
jgi:hypothetical protein